MVLISSSAIIRGSALYHITLAYYLLTSPVTLAQQSLVVVLGAAMDISSPSESLFIPSSATAFAALLAGMMALNDIAAPSMASPAGRLYWSDQAPLRAAFGFVATGSIYAGSIRVKSLKEMGELDGIPETSFATRRALCNSFVFTFVFLEMLLWFWTFTVIREERKQLIPEKKNRQ